MPSPWGLRILFRETAFASAGFTAAIYLYFLTSNWGIRDHLTEGPLKEYLSSPAIHLQHITAGIMFGVGLSVVNQLAEKTWLRQRSFGFVVLVRSAYYVVGVALVAATVALLFILTSVLSVDSLLQLLRDFSAPYLISIGIWLAVVVIGVNYMQEIRRLVGEGNLWRLLTGHYRRPRSEERVFLFMDLVASTTIAEKLGHEGYSEFIQECFQDLTAVVLNHGGTIYQYVGDEVVMTWPERLAGARIRSVRTFFAYERILSDKGPWYEERFGVAPVVRGGIAVGPVMATEVGEIKRAIAYHGDAINTASRLLDLCKEQKGRLLVSGEVGVAALEDPSVSTDWQDDVFMRGKSASTHVYSLEAGEAE